jgi:hypothetical protein
LDEVYIYPVWMALLAEPSASSEQSGHPSDLISVRALTERRPCVGTSFFKSMQEKGYIKKKTSQDWSGDCMPFESPIVVVTNNFTHLKENIPYSLLIWGEISAGF